MTTMNEEQSKAAPGPLALVQALVNTQYGQGRHAHVELTSPEQLRVWLVAHRLLADGTPVTQGVPEWMERLPVCWALCLQR